jgi:hypothetical protein
MTPWDGPISSSGSGPGGIYDDWSYLTENNSTMDTISETGEVSPNDMVQSWLSFGQEEGGQSLGQFTQGLSFDHKTAPSFDGSQSFYTFEEHVYEWEDITSLLPEKRGPALAARLTGEAAVHKKELNRDILRSKEDRVAMDHVLNTLRPHFLKGAAATFLHRMVRYMQLRRGRMDLLRWISRYALMKNRLLASWMDTYNSIDPMIDREEYRAVALRYEAAVAAAHGDVLTEPAELSAAIDNFRKVEFQNKFPFSDNLFTIMFLIQSELSDQNRQTLMQHLSLRNIKTHQYSWISMVEIIKELFISSRGSMDDPYVNYNGGDTRKGGGKKYLQPKLLHH